MWVSILRGCQCESKEKKLRSSGGPAIRFDILSEVPRATVIAYECIRISFPILPAEREVIFHGILQFEY